MWDVVFEYFDTTNSTERCFKAVSDADGSPRCNFYLDIFCADFIEGVVRRPKIFSNVLFSYSGNGRYELLSTLC